MKKYNKQLSVALLILFFFSISLGTLHASSDTFFKDVGPHFWGYQNIQWAIENKVVEGYPDGTFKPNLAASESEFLAMIIRSYQPADFRAGSDPDPANWAAPYLNYGVKLGWKGIAPSPLMRHPTNYMSLSRGMVAQYLANATGKNYSMDDSIQYLLDIGLAEGKTEKSLEGFNKGDSVTRAEAVTFIKQLRLKYNQLQSSPRLEEKYNRSEAQSMTYENKTYNFTLRLPISWEGKYEVVDRVVSYGNNIEFINKATKYGILFTISVWSKEAWKAHEDEIKGQIPISEIGESGDEVYLFHTPTDVQYDPNDETSKADYLSMFNDIKAIAKTFKISSLTPDIEGYVTKAEAQKALVVSPKAKDFSPRGGLKEYYDAVWISDIPEGIKVGQKVQVWFKGEVLESYPAQTTVGKILILPREKPFNAKLSEEQVIQQAIVNQENANIRVFVIKEVKFDLNKNIWEIRIKEGMPSEEESKEYIIQIPDKLS